MSEDEGDPEQWLARQKRRGNIRMLVIGLVILAAGSVWAITYWNHGVGMSPITYVRVVSTLVIGIGTGLTIASVIRMARGSR